MKLFKKKNWAFYLFLFGVLAVAYFLVSIFIDHPGDIRRAIISALVSGGIFTILWWLIDKLSKVQEGK